MTWVSPFPELLLLGLFALALILLARLKQSDASFVGARQKWTLPAIRLAACLILLIVLLNPSVELEEPDPEAYHLAVAVDASASMLTRDTAHGSRLQTVEHLLLHPDNGLLERWQQNHRLKLYRFSEHIQPVTSLASADLVETTLPGLTAIGETLVNLGQPEIDQTSAETQPGALILFSDGQNLRGRSPAEAAQTLRQTKLPVHVVGIGERNPGPDTQLFLKSAPESVVRDTPFRIEAQVRHEGSRPPQDITVGLYSMTGTLLATEKAPLDESGQSHIHFELSSPVLGTQAFRIRLENNLPDRNSANDVDFAMVEVTPPERFRIFYAATRPAWQSRFLNQALQQTAQFELLRLQKVGEEGWRMDSSSEDFRPPEIVAPPDSAAFWMTWDALVLETTFLAALPAAALQGLRSFVAERGGGLLLFGPPEAAQQSGFSAFLPAPEEAFRRVVPDSPVSLSFAPTPLFVEAAGDVLRKSPPPLLPANEPVYLMENLKPGGRSASWFEQEAQSPAVLAFQNYGAGRSAYLGSSTFWKWRLDSDHGKFQHDAFWRALLVWLSTGTRPRIDTPLQAGRFTVDAPIHADITVRGSDFQPRSDARVTARIRRSADPQAPERILTLQPDLEMPGKMVASFMPEAVGEYQITYEIRFPEGEVFFQEAWFVAAPLGDESRQTDFAEAPLRDLARLSGGRYFHYSELADFDQPALAPGIPHIAQPLQWARTSPVLALLITLMATEWILRRRRGLR